MAVVTPGGVDAAGVATTAAPATSPATPIAGRRWDRAVILFLGPTALLMLIFLIYPTLYTIALSFNRGRRGRVHRMGRPAALHRAAQRQVVHQSEHVPAVGRDLEQRALGDLLYGLRDLPRTRGRGARLTGPVRIDHQGRRLPADGDRGDRARDHLELRLRARSQHRAAERDPRIRSRRGASRGSATPPS